MKNVFDVILLTALPASGKSEIRNFMAHMEPSVLQAELPHRPEPAAG
jgi:dephospho-CoA kinase